MVAARLAEAGHAVLLVEAGPDLRGRERRQLRNGWEFDRENAGDISANQTLRALSRTSCARSSLGAVRG